MLAWWLAIFFLIGRSDLAARREEVFLETTAAVGSRRDTAQTFRRYQFSWLRDLSVENRDGFEVGSLQDFVVELDAGQVRYAIITSGGFAGFGAQEKIVPPGALSMATTKKGVLALELSRGRWAQAPGFSSDSLVTLNQPGRTQEIYRYYAQSPAEPALAPRQGIAGDQALEPTGRPGPESGSALGQKGGLALASTLIGWKVIDPQGGALGRVSDLLVDLEGEKPPLALVTAGGWLKHKETFALPLSALRAAEGDKLVAKANRQMFKQAPPLDEHAWKTAGGRATMGVYRYREPRA